MSWHKEEKSSNFPRLCSRNLLPNLWLKWERSDRTPLSKADARSTFSALIVKGLKNDEAFASKMKFDSLDDFDASRDLSLVSDWCVMLHLCTKFSKSILLSLVHVILGCIK